MTTISKPLWIGPDESLRVGDTGFLILLSHPGRTDRYIVRGTPARTNQSFENRLYGWCGSYNDLSTYACGIVRVVRVARNGRVLVAQLTGASRSSALDELGYPDLDPGAAYAAN